MKHNFKKGDILYISWGYDQTNVDFYRVKELRGQTQLILQGVDLDLIKTESEGFMTATRAYNPKKWTLKSRDVFIKDNIKGKIAKVIGELGDFQYVKIGNHVASHYSGKPLYESWYA